MDLDSHIQKFIEAHSGERVFNALKGLATNNNGYIFDAKAIVREANGGTSRPQNGNTLLTPEVVPLALLPYVLDGNVLIHPTKTCDLSSPTNGLTEETFYSIP